MNATIPPSTVSPRNPPPAALPPQPPAPTLSTTRILAAIITKEFRHHWIYTAFLYVLAVILCYVTLAASSSFSVFLSYSPPEMNFLLYSAWHLSSLLIFPFAGLFFGIAQASADRNFDLWAFLIHRPVPRTTLFVGRVLAGFILYFASVGVPLLIAFIIASRSGEFFHWRFMLPSIADFLTGLIYYFAGLLIVTRRALLFGSRFIPIFVALACSVTVISIPYFSAALALIVLALVLFSTAALGAYLSHGFTLPVSSILRQANNLILLLACTILLFVAFLNPTLAAVFFVRNSIPKPVENLSAGNSTYYLLAADGTLVKSVHTFAARSLERKASIESQFFPAHYYDMEGHEIPEPTLPPQRDSTSSGDSSSAMFYPDYRYRHRFEMDYRDTPSLVTRNEVYHRENDGKYRIIEMWYFVITDGLFYGYDADTKHFLGVIGQNGFTQSKSAATPWGETVSAYPKKYGEFLWTSRQLFSVDLDHRNVELLFTAPPDDPLIDVDRRILEETPAPTATQPNHVIFDEQGLFVRTSRNIYLFRGNFADGDSYLHGTPVKYALAKSGDSSSLDIKWFKAANRIALFYRTYNDYYSGDYDPKALLSSHNPAIFDIFDYQTGSPIARYDLPDYVAFDPPQYSMPPIPAYYAPSVGAILGTFNAIANPLFIAPINYLHNLFYPDNSWQTRQTLFMLDRYNAGADQPIRYSVMFFLLIASAAFTRLLAARYHLRHPNLWALLALLCGPAALLTLIAANYLPVRTPCPICHKKRPVQEPLCPHCCAPFPPPTPTNTEIFA